MRRVAGRCLLCSCMSCERKMEGGGPGVVRASHTRVVRPLVPKATPPCAQQVATGPRVFLQVWSGVGVCHGVCVVSHASVSQCGTEAHRNRVGLYLCTARLERWTESSKWRAPGKHVHALVDTRL